MSDSPSRCCDAVKVFKNGVLIDTIDDLITTVGLAWIANRIVGTGGVGAITHMAIGTGTTAPKVVGATTLETETARVALTTSGGVPTANIVVFEASFGPGVGTGTISELGLLTASTAGTLVTTNLKGPYTKDASDTLVFVATITIS